MQYKLCNLSKWPLQFYYHQRPPLFKLPFLQPSIIGSLPSLTELWLDHNQLQHLPPVSFFLSNPQKKKYQLEKIRKKHCQLIEKQIRKKNIIWKKLEEKMEKKKLEKKKKKNLEKNLEFDNFFS